LFNCIGEFSWPGDEPPDGVSNETFKNPLLVEDDRKKICEESNDIIAIPGQMEADPYK
jgi:hypothetical protein